MIISDSEKSVDALKLSITQTLDKYGEYAVYDLWEQGIKDYPENISFQLDFCDFLITVKARERCMSLLESLHSAEPTHIEILKKLAECSSQIGLYETSLEALRKCLALQPQNVNFVIRFIKTLLKMENVEEAEHVYYEYSQLLNKPGHKAILEEIRFMKGEYLSSLQELQILSDKFPKAYNVYSLRIHLLGVLYRVTNDKKYVVQLFELLELLRAKKEGFDRLAMMQMLLHGRNSEAASFFEKLPPENSVTHKSLNAWKAHMVDGDVETAKGIWREILKFHIIPQAVSAQKGTLKKLDKKPICFSEDSIVIYTAIKDEKWRLSWFLDYYRQRGVDHFVFIDNDSNDGATEYLLEQEDVHLFWTDQSYADSFSSMQWINGLVEEYGADCWCMYVDVDEALVFPGCEQNSIKHLTRYMKVHNYEAFQAFMLDMYSSQMQLCQQNESSELLQENNNYFVNDYTSIGSMRCPYVSITGGLRKLFSEFTNEQLVKVPIIRGGRDIKFLQSSHGITPAVLSDVTGVLLHYKFAGNFKYRFERELAQYGRIPACKNRHFRYIKKLEEKGSWSTDKTTKYESSRQLEGLGLIRSSAAFENFTSQDLVLREGESQVLEAAQKNMKQKNYTVASEFFKLELEKDPACKKALHGLVRIAEIEKDRTCFIQRSRELLSYYPEDYDIKLKMELYIAKRNGLASFRRCLYSIIEKVCNRALTDLVLAKQLYRSIQYSLCAFERLRCLRVLLDAVGMGAEQEGEEQSALLFFKADLLFALKDYSQFELSLQIPVKNRLEKLQLHRLKRLAEKVNSANFNDFGAPKVFCIGLSRTGTTSLNKAFNMLGLQSIHWFNPRTQHVIDDQDLLLYDAFTDISISYRFEELYHTFPNAKFILTLRNREAWMKSVSTHYKNIYNADVPLDLTRASMSGRFGGRADCIEHNLYSRYKTWAEAYDAYEQRVQNFFADKSADKLLRMNITEGEGWDKLCPFLGKEEPESFFPAVNKGPVKFS